MKESIKTIIIVAICLIIAVFVTYNLITSKPTERKECPPGTHKSASFLYECLPAIELSNGWTCFNEKLMTGNSVSIYNKKDERAISLRELENGKIKIEHDKAMDRLSAEQLITECKTKLNEKDLLLPPP